MKLPKVYLRDLISGRVPPNDRVFKKLSKLLKIFKKNVKTIKNFVIFKKITMRAKTEFFKFYNLSLPLSLQIHQILTTILVR
jgi:hypothetical protein